jgi:hypothetical protein
VKRKNFLKKELSIEKEDFLELENVVLQVAIQNLKTTKK